MVHVQRAHMTQRALHYRHIVCTRHCVTAVTHIPMYQELRHHPAWIGDCRFPCWMARIVHQGHHPSSVPRKANTCDEQPRPLACIVSQLQVPSARLVQCLIFYSDLHHVDCLHLRSWYDPSIHPSTICPMVHLHPTLDVPPIEHVVQGWASAFIPCS
jgi:hypothetical protein